MTIVFLFSLTEDLNNFRTNVHVDQSLINTTNSQFYKYLCECNLTESKVDRTLYTSVIQLCRRKSQFNEKIGDFHLYVDEGRKLLATFVISVDFNRREF